MSVTPRKRWGNTPDTLCLAPWWWVAESESGTSRRRWEKTAAVEHPHFCKTSGTDVRQVLFKICDNARKTYFFLILAPITIESFFFFKPFYLNTCTEEHTCTPLPPQHTHTRTHTHTHACTHRFTQLLMHKCVHMYTHTYTIHKEMHDFSMQLATYPPTISNREREREKGEGGRGGRKACILNVDLLIFQQRVVRSFCHVLQPL